MKDFIQIKDSIFGDIELNRDEQRIVNDPNFQRLRYIKQTGFLHLVYPGANHTRFEHSIGTMNLTKGMCQKLNLENEELILSGLLHDIGHTPFSHQTEEVVIRYLHKNHEQIGEELISKSSIRDRISESSLSLKKVLHYFRGKQEGQIITGPLGSDRIDYLMRDSHYTGATYGTIEFERLKSKILLKGTTPVIQENGITSAESMLIARYHMFLSAYLHHTTLIAGSMFRKALYYSIESGEIDPKTLQQHTDLTLISEMIKIKGKTRDLTKRILDRRLFKRVFSSKAEDIDTEEIKQKILGYGISDEAFIVTQTRLNTDIEGIDVVDSKNKIIGSLKDESKLLEALSKAPKGKNILIIASNEKYNKKMGEIVKKIL